MEKFREAMWAIITHNVYFTGSWWYAWLQLDNNFMGFIGKNVTKKWIIKQKFQLENESVPGASNLSMSA